MRWIVVAVLLAAAIVAGSFAIAQQAGNTGSASAAASPASAEGAVTDRAVMGDWVYGCVADAAAKSKRCFIRQQLADSKTKTPLATLTVARDAKGNLLAVWQIPTGVMVNHGMLFDIGTAKAIPVPYRACLRGHCQAVANLTPDFVGRFAKAEKARATIVAVSGKGIAFDFSVRGLPDALAALTKK